MNTLTSLPASLASIFARARTRAVSLRLIACAADQLRRRAARVAIIVALSLGGLAQPMLPALASEPAIATPAARDTPPAIAPAPTSTTSDREDWHVLMLDGARAGHMMSRVKTTGTTIATEIEMKLKIKRGAINMGVEISSIFEETTDGKPLRMKSIQKLGAQAITQERTFTETGVRVVRTQGDQTVTEEAPLPEGKWFTPAAGARELKRRVDAGEKVITMTVLDPSSGDQPITFRRTFLEQTVIAVMGRDVPALKCSVHVDKFGGIDVVEYTTLEGVSIKSVIDMGVMKVEQVLADKALALSKLDAPELLISTLVKPNKPISNPRKTTRAVYVLSVDGGKPLTIEAGAGQQVDMLTEHKAKVTVEPATSEWFAADEALKATHLQSSAMLAHEDTKIRELLKQADDPTLKTRERCERLRRFVHSYIDAKDLSVGFASASEIARTKTGDCTEHGVLLAALLRAAGIPARVASGLIYVDEFAGAERIFGYHLWTQALVDGPDGRSQWLSLDATLPDDTKFDATHILLQTSSLNGGVMDNLMVNMVPMLGRLKIDVQEIK